MINHSLGSLIKTEHNNNLQLGLVMNYLGAKYENHTTFYDSLGDSNEYPRTSTTIFYLISI